MNRLLLGLIALFLPSLLQAQTTIRESSNGPPILFVKGNEISADHLSPRLLYLDTDSIRKEPTSSRMLVLDNDGDVRKEPGSPRIAVFEKDNTIRREPNGKILFWAKHPEVRAESSGKLVYYIDGAPLTRIQLLGVLYHLQPSLFALSDAENAKKLAEMKKNEKDEDARVAGRLVGAFDIINSGAKVFSKGKAGVKHVGKYLYMTYDFEGGAQLKGIGLYLKAASDFDDQIVTALSKDGAVGMGVFELLDNGFDGVWYPTSLLADGTTSLGIEKLKGKVIPGNLSGRYSITAAKTPGKGDTYTGTVDIKQVQRTDGGIIPTYSLTWNLGKAKLYGVGIEVALTTKDMKKKRYLVTAVGTGEVIVGQHFSTTSSDVHLDFSALGNTIAGGEHFGAIMLAK